MRITNSFVTLLRMTLDVYGQLYANKVLVELGKQINEIWNDKR